MVRRLSKTVILFALVSLANTSPLRQPTEEDIPHEMHHAQKRSFVTPCKPLSYVTLVIKLNSIGGYNKRYVATTKQEALQNFPNLLNTTIVPSATSYATVKPVFTASSNVAHITPYPTTTAMPKMSSHIAPDTPSNSTMKPEYTTSTQTTPSPTTTAVPKMSSHIVPNTSSSYATPTPTLSSYFTQATPTMQPGKEINTQMIFKALRGTKDKYGFYRLCTEWTAITTLSSDFFPRYLNEVICDSKDFHCLSNGGLCVQKTFVVSILRRSGKCTAQGREEWLEYSQPIRSCCECKMFPGSAYTWLL